MAHGLAIRSHRRGLETWPDGAQSYGSHCGIRGVHENGRTNMFKQAVCEVAVSLTRGTDRVSEWEVVPY